MLTESAAISHSIHPQPSAMGPDWECLQASEAKAEELQKKQRLKQFKNKKLEDKNKIHKVWVEDECGPIVTCVHTFDCEPLPLNVKRIKLNGDEWEPLD